ncbi:hypothetical protein E3N88_29529 [Mikania micrantha]|uniref:Uncharacterized protein n=1 Tax=Mikania micrantha TaxID=192012 RepID=A0A5N6MJR1_9ASTR|nr:hypothetical protein E3N88_29529 [Mikania micrantha]
MSSSRELWRIFCNASVKVVIVVGRNHAITILTGTVFGPFAGHKFHNEIKNPTLQFVDFSNIDTTNFESLSGVSLVGIFSLWVEHEDLVTDTRVRVHICPMTKPQPYTRGSQPILLFFYESYVAIDTLLQNFEGMSRQNVLTWTVFPPSLHSFVLKLGLAFKLLVPFLIVPFYANFGCIIAHYNVSLPHSIHITPDGKQQLEHYMSQAWYLQAINLTVKVAQRSIQINLVLAYIDMVWFVIVQKMFALTSHSIIANVKIIIGVAVSTLAHVATLYKLTYVILSLMTHGFCVHTILRALNFSWLHWSQASPPLCEKQVAYISCLDPFNEANLNTALTICLSDEKLFNKMFALAEVFEAGASFMDPEITSFDAFMDIHHLKFLFTSMKILQIWKPNYWKGLLA